MVNMSMIITDPIVILLILLGGLVYLHIATKVIISAYLNAKAKFIRDMILSRMARKTEEKENHGKS